MTTLDSKQSTMRARQRTKRCSDCSRTKPVTEFYASADYADGRWAKCKECVRKRNGTYKQKKRAQRKQATLPVAAPPTESPVEAPPERPQGQRAPAIAIVAVTDDDKFAHLRRVPVCICAGNSISPSCEVHWACRIDPRYDRAPASTANYTDFNHG